MIVSAPGKVLLLGEYAVTQAGRALVAAVDVRAHARAMPPGGTESPVIAGVRSSIGSPAAERGVHVDTRAFRDDHGRKYGFGSSAATAVTSAAILLASTDDEVLSVALAGHAVASGGTGSGVDVAASYHGGVVVLGRQPGPVAPARSGFANVTLHVFRLGPPVTTSELVAKCRASPDWERWHAVLVELAEEGITAYARGRFDPFRSAVARYLRALDGLGSSAGVPIVTESAQALARAAMNRGGVAKTSGAGGGDVAVAWLPADVDADQLGRDVGIERLPVGIDPVGLRLESAP